MGLYEDPNENQFELLRRLSDRGAVSEQAAQLFHDIRKAGNQATHGTYGEHRTALSHLKYARWLGVWYHKAYGGARSFKVGPFLPPPDPQQEQAALKEELEKLRQTAAQQEAELAATQSWAQQAQQIAAEEAELRQIAEALLIEVETQAEAASELAARLSEMQAAASKAPAEVQSAIATAQTVDQELPLDERETRRLIDAQLRAAGWEVDSERMTYGNGTRPQKGKNWAIAEWPTTNGRADYALFVGLQVLGVVEAKRKRKDVYGAIDRAKRYSREYVVKGAEELPGGPWEYAGQAYKVPFVFATNGRAFLPQLETKSGIWFCDVRRAENIR